MAAIGVRQGKFGENVPNEDAVATWKSKYSMIYLCHCWMGD